MTRRERKEARVARHLEWATGRDRRATAGFDQARHIADAIPFGQPILVGHHSEGHARRDQARIEAGMRQGVESQDMAAHHRSVADGIARQLATSVFSDDPDAPERLRERIAGLEADRDRQKAANREIKKGPGWEARLSAAGIALTDHDKAELLSVARYQPYLADKKTGLPVFPTYHFTNLGANIRRLKERLGQIETTRDRAQRAEAAGGVVIERLPGGEHVRVTFAEKPAREILDALKAAGFRWGAGAWLGQTAKLPAEITQEEAYT